MWELAIVQLLVSLKIVKYVLIYLEGPIQLFGVFKH